MSRVRTSWILRLPWQRPPLTLNQRGASIGSRMAQADTVRQIRGVAKVLATNAKIGPRARIHVRLHWQPELNRRRDEDNLIPTLKPLIDGLVDAGITPDDGSRYIDWSRPVIHPANKAVRPSMWLTVEDISTIEGSQ